jgi:hypothetical protein
VGGGIVPWRLATECGLVTRGLHDRVIRPPRFDVLESSRPHPGREARPGEGISWGFRRGSRRVSPALPAPIGFGAAAKAGRACPLSADRPTNMISIMSGQLFFLGASLWIRDLRDAIIVPLFAGKARQIQRKCPRIGCYFFRSGDIGRPSAPPVGSSQSGQPGCTDIALHTLPFSSASRGCTAVCSWFATFLGRRPA